MDTQTMISDTGAIIYDLIQEVKSIPPEQINVVPFDGSWTAGQLAEHLVLSCGGFVELMNGPVEDTQRQPDQMVAKLKEVFLDYNLKMKSPDFIDPPVKNYDKEELINVLMEIKQKLDHSMQTLELSKTCTAFELPQMGYVTRIEAMAFVLYHTSRHLHQLKKIHDELAKTSELKMADK
ncbi:MAG: DinB family protein [Ferruginibacter sp.]